MGCFESIFKSKRTKKTSTLDMFCDQLPKMVVWCTQTTDQSESTIWVFSVTSVKRHLDTLSEKSIHHHGPSLFRDSNPQVFKDFSGDKFLPKGRKLQYSEGNNRLDTLSAKENVSKHLLVHRNHLSKLREYLTILLKRYMGANPASLRLETSRHFKRQRYSFLTIKE